MFFLLDPVLHVFQHVLELDQCHSMQRYDKLCFLTGARGQYVDVLAGSASAKSNVPLDNLFNVLPKSASVPAKLFIPPSSK